MKPEEQWTPVDYWHDLHSEDHDLELETYLRVANDLAEYAAQLEAYCDKLAEGLPEGMLPKDIELINETNVKLLVEIEQLRGENSALRANTSKSVLRRLKAQGALGNNTAKELLK